MRPIAVLVAVAALGLTVSAGAATQSGTSLRVTYWEDGSKAEPDASWTLRCDPPRGTLPRPKTACARLAKGGWKLFTPVPPDMACTQIYGGPQKARVVGVVGGRHVWTTFTRTDGCQIERWSRLSPWLLPPGGVTR